MRSRLALFVLLAATHLTVTPLLAAARTYALPEAVTAFRPGQGQEVAENNCLACHSSDYISTQPPGLGKKFWEAEVRKMQKAYGAQISEEDATAIIDYLSRAY